MRHGIYKVTGHELLGDYRIRVSFSDGVKREIDFTPILHGELFGALRDPKTFNKVFVDPETSTLTWPNGADFDPETLYNWDQCVDELVARFAA